MKNKISTDNLYNRKGITDILSNISCVDNNDNCNVLKPYSKIDLYSVNPVSNKIYTASERKVFIDNFDNKCKNYSKNSKKNICCSKNINKVNYENGNNELLLDKTVIRYAKKSINRMIEFEDKYYQENKRVS